MTTAIQTAPTANGKAPMFLMVALGAIFFDEDGILGAPNVRGKWEYETDPNPKYKPKTGDGGKAGLYEDVEENGLTTPLWVVILTPTEREFLHAQTGVWYDYLCIRGHRRGRVLKMLAAKYPGRFDQIPCQVYSDLSESERINLKVDQVHVKGLSDWGIYLAIKALAYARLTEPQIATRIGMSRGFVQAKLRIARLPQIVEDEYLKKCKGEAAVNLTDKNLNALMIATKADTDKGITADADGTPGFKAEWATIVATGEQTNKPPTAMSRKDLLIIIGMTKDSIIADTLRYAAGDPVQLPQIVANMETLRTQATAYVAMMANDPASNPPATEPTEPTATEPTDTAPTLATDTASVPFETEPTDTAPTEPTDPPARPTLATAGKGKGNGRRGNGKR